MGFAKVRRAIRCAPPQHDALAQSFYSSRIPYNPPDLETQESWVSFPSCSASDQQLLVPRGGGERRVVGWAADVTPPLEGGGRV